MRHLAFLLALSALALVVGVRAGGAAAAPAVTGYPSSMAALGDSITRAANPQPPLLGDQPQYSWSTGTEATVQSHYLRILQQNAAISGNNFNDAVSGAKMADLNGQATVAVGQGVDFVTILMGGNDICTSSEATMTPVATYRFQFQQAMDTLTSGLPDARVFVASIPDVYNLWFILKDNSSARTVWSLFGICQSLLANPLSTAQADVDRRDRVRQRNIDFNTQLAEVCAQYVHCRYDNNLGFDTPFTASDVSTLDYFHPSIQGQTLSAAVSWTATFDFTDNVAPVSLATVTPFPGGGTLAVTAIDDVSMGGIEYRLNGGAYQPYTGALAVTSGNTITYRAVDVNGNIEATHDCTVRVWPVSPGDDDCDGFADAEEAFVGTDALDPCANTPDANDEADDRWPADFNDDQTVDILDIVQLTPPAFNSSPPDPNYLVRKDLNGDGAINILDIVRMTPPLFGQSCAP